LKSLISRGVAQAGRAEILTSTLSQVFLSHFSSALRTQSGTFQLQALSQYFLAILASATE
jgi:hypothetical protein